MAATISHAPVRLPVTIAHGGAGLLVAAGTAVAGDHSVEVALITAASGVAVVIIGPMVSSWLRGRHKPVDHHSEVIAEQKELVAHLVAELAELRGENKDLDNENKRLRRRAE